MSILKLADRAPPTIKPTPAMEENTDAVALDALGDAAVDELIGTDLVGFLRAELQRDTEEWKPLP